MSDSIKNLSPDQVAFVEQLTVLQGAMRDFCNSIMFGDHGVDDVLQESNRVILEKASEFTPGTNFRAWVFSIIRFQAMAYYKKASREKKVVFSTGLTQSLLDESLGQNQSYVDKMAALERCVAELRTTERELLGNRYWGKKTLGEYAKEVGRSVDALKRSLFRIRKRLRGCVERRLAVEGDP